MSTSRIKDKVSELVNSQLPEFIRSDYTTFVAFLEYYYKFLEQDQEALELVQNARKYSDIDQTAESFINYFITNYAKDLPITLQVNKSLLIKRIEGLYKAKGSNISIETLFKVLYDTYAVTRHPYDFVLRPSDGQWSLRTSIRVLITSGSVIDIKDRFLKLTKNNIAYTVEITRVKNLTANLYEIFYKSIVSVPFEINDTVYVDSATATIFTGTVKPTTVRGSVSKGGSGFRAGQVFNVTVSGAVDTVVRITKVNSIGSIQGIRILNYGYNFTNDVTIVLTNALGVTARSKPLATKGGGFAESFEMLKTLSITDAGRYFLTDYVDPFTYSGSLEASTNTSSQILTSSTIAGEENASDAIISFEVGAIARYPGEYTSTQGFLSEPDVRLQDGNLYQPFAYQIESDLDISVFYDLVKKLVHQAGTNLFVNRVISTTANISASITVETRKNVFLQLNSVFATLDSAQVALLKNLGTDEATASDSLTISLTKGLADNISILDTFNLVQYWEAYYDNVTPSESLVFSISKPIIDESNVSITDALVQTFGKNIDNADSIISLTEAGEGILLNYTESTGASGYFLDIYAGESVLTFS